MPLLVRVCVKLYSDRVCVFQVVVDTNGSDLTDVSDFIVYDSEHVVLDLDQYVAWSLNRL